VPLNTSGVLSPITDGYRLVDGTPTVEDYLELRVRSGLTPKREEQAAAALPGSWAACHVLHDAQDRSVAMGRVLGDGGWYFHVADMAVLPEHQRRGLGSAVLDYLLEQIRARAPEGALVTLFADPPGRPLYARHGFVESAPSSIGMTLLLGP
jgi:GNAT superfamily N-acetyltransferase